MIIIQVGDYLQANVEHHIDIQMSVNPSYSTVTEQILHQSKLFYYDWTDSTP